MKKLIDWILSLFKEEYELTVWFQTETTIVDAEGNSTTSKSKRTYNLSSITKRSQTHIIGKDLNGLSIEIRTVDPFDYTIRKIK